MVDNLERAESELKIKDNDLFSMAEKDNVS
jgi:hypothetical protein